MKLWSWDPSNTVWMQVDEGDPAEMRATADRRNLASARHGLVGAAYLALDSTPSGGPAAYGVTPVAEREPDPGDAPKVGDPWPDGLDAKLAAALVLVCPCGAHVDAAGGMCETCGREFDERGRRVVGQGDLDNLDGDGQLQADPDPDLTLMRNED